MSVSVFVWDERCEERERVRVLACGDGDVYGWGHAWSCVCVCVCVCVSQRKVWVRVVFGVCVRWGANENEAMASQFTGALTCHALMLWSAPVLLCMQNEATALMNASEQGHLEVAKLLLEHGAKVDLQDKVMSGDG